MHTDRAPLVTVVIVPRARFSCAQDALKGVLKGTRDVDHQLLYVDDNSPKALQRYIDMKAAKYDFSVLRTRHYLGPNQAKNMALAHVKTRYVAFVDNDVVVAPGWLKALLECAEETGAAVVTPLVCEGYRELHTTIHTAGGETFVREEARADGSVQRILVARMNLLRRRVADYRDQLRRQETGMAEVHCLLARMDLFDKIGPFDEQIVNTRDHIDFCLRVREQGQKIWLEPKAICTFTGDPPDRPLEWRDLPCFMLRWSDTIERRTLLHLMRKWRLTDDGYFSNRMQNIGWRRDIGIWRPIARKLSFGIENRPLNRALFLADRVLNRLVTAHYERRARILSRQPPELRLSGARRVARPRDLAMPAGQGDHAGQAASPAR